MNRPDHGGGAGVAAAVRRLQERRTLLWVPVAVAGAALLRAAPLAAASADEAQEKVAGGALAPLSRDEFARRWTALATELKLLPSRCDEAYAAALAALIARLPLDALPKLDGTRPATGMRGGPSWQLVPCLTVEFQMAPGAEIRTHNHPPQAVVSLCAEGELAYRHFELHGEAPPCTRIDGTGFELRETRSGLLLPGRTTSLTRARDGLHDFVAGDDGARLVDFICGLAEDFETFSYVELTPEPIDADRRLWGGVWTGKKR